ncbi:Secreted effector protein SseC [Thalassocella blandensis]|nr:Secreted effector protein SseC [Thalassocella blandensis]
MTIGNLTPIHTTTAKSGESMSDVVEESLNVALQEQAREFIRDQSLTELTKKIKSNPNNVPLEEPEYKGKGGDYYQVMVLALSRMAGLMGDMADSTQIELQFKREEIKQLLKDKLESIEQKEERRQQRIAAEKALEEQKKHAGIWGSVMSFVFAAAEIIGGAFVTAAGVISGNPVLIAGGASLIAAGSLEIAAEVMTLTGGNEDTINKMKMAAMGLMAVGLALSTFGAASAGATGAMVGKKAAQEGAEAAVKKGTKEATEAAAKKASKEATESAVERNMKYGAEAFTVGHVTSNVGNSVAQTYLAVKQNQYDKRAADLQHDIEVLQAELDATIEKQEYINKLIQIIQEHWTRAMLGPVDEAMKILNSAIQDHGGVSRRIAASFGV